MNLKSILPKTILHLLLVYFPFFFLSSCEYEPNKVFTNPTKPNPGSPTINVVELNMDEDTVYLYADKTVSFKFTSSNQDIRTVVYQVDTTIMETVASGNGEFLMKQNDFFDGVYKLSIKVYTGSGTGSIADQIGAEGYLFEKNWVLIVNRKYGSPINYSVQNGNLRLDWSPFHGSDFKEFVIYRWDIDYTSHEIGRSTSNYFIDSCYVGEGGDYSIKAITKSGTEMFWCSIQLNKELPRLDYSSTQTNQFYVYWNKSKYFNGIAKVDVFQRNASYTYQQVYTSTSLADSTYEFNNGLFGESMNFMIKLTPKKYSFGYLPINAQNQSVYKDIFVGYHFSLNISQQVKINEVENNEILYDDESLGLVRFSLTTLKNTQTFYFKNSLCETSRFSDLDVSPLGKYYISHICDFEHFITAKSSSLSNYQLKDLSYLTGQQAWEIPISDTRIGLVSSLLWQAGIYLYDFNTQAVIANYTKNPTTSTGKCISSNGDYMFINDNSMKLIHYANHSFTELQSFPDYPYPFIEFSRTDADQFVIYDKSVFKVEKCSDLSVVYSFPLQGEKLMSVDYKNKQILTAANLHLYVRSMIDGSLLHDIPVRTDQIYSFYNCCLADHKIISSLGVIYFL